MTDSTFGERSADGEFDVGPSADELFGDVPEDDAAPAAESTADAGVDDAVEDQTAADVFSELSETVDDAEGDDLLDESPEDLIELADEPDETGDRVVEGLFDEEAFEQLILTDRREGEEFLWVQTPDAAADAADDETDTETGGEVTADATSAIQAAANDATWDRDGGSDDSTLSGGEPAPTTATESADAVEDGADRLAALRNEALGDSLAGAAEPTVDAEADETGADPSPADDADDAEPSTPEATDVDLGAPADDSLGAADADGAPADSTDAVTALVHVDEETALEPVTDEETALEPVTRDETALAVTTDDSATDDGRGGLLGWLRSTLSRLF